MNLRNGTLLQGGKYRIEGVLGQGGFGITYRATQVMLERTVAIKEFFMKDMNGRDGASGAVTTPSTGSALQVEQYRRKFVKEARNLAGLEHPHIVRIIDIFEERGTVYYVMPYMSGGSLHDVVKRGGPLAESQALDYVRQVASALHYMHEQKQLCHYDVKPANILLDSAGKAVLIDFGISKNYDREGHETSTTPIGMSEGYAPIEQYQGQVQEFSPASDVYALGATLYFLLSGQRPPTAIDRIGGAALALPASVSQATRQLVEQAMTIARQLRPQSVAMFLEESSPGKTVGDPDVTVVEVPPAAQPVKRPTSQQQLKDETFTVGGVTFKMIAVEGGTFRMGATAEQGTSDPYSDEYPTHQVTLSSYSIGETEVTQALWVAVMGSNPSWFTRWFKRKKQQDHPVHNVTWGDCQNFIHRLNSLTGKRFRLPTEAEWEFAARGGNKSKGYKYSGSNTLDDVAWYNDNNISKTHPVATKAPNELGLYDMSGNVWECCHDWSGGYNGGAQTNPTGPTSGSNRVYRGGSWFSNARRCRVSSRSNFSPSSSYSFLGFRLAL